MCHFNQVAVSTGGKDQAKRRVAAQSYVWIPSDEPIGIHLPAGWSIVHLGLELGSRARNKPQDRKRTPPFVHRLVRGGGGAANLEGLEGGPYGLIWSVVAEEGPPPPEGPVGPDTPPTGAGPPASAAAGDTRDAEALVDAMRDAEALVDMALTMDVEAARGMKRQRAAGVGGVEEPPEEEGTLSKRQK